VKQGALVVAIATALGCQFEPAHLRGDPSGDASTPAHDAPPTTIDAAPPDALPPDAAPADVVSCPPDYVVVTYGCWRIVDEPMTFEEAEARCVIDGGHLIVIDSAEENDAADALAQDREAWIGYTDHADEGTFLWVTDAGEAYERWNGGEPNNSWGVEDCAHIRADGSWNDTSCSDDRTFLCEVDGLAQGTMYW
jgi:hypothetical protein